MKKKPTNPNPTNLRIIVCKCEDESISTKDSIYGRKSEGMKAVKRIFKSNQELSKSKEL